MKYVEYVEAETAAGREPLPLGKWRGQLMRDSQAANAIVDSDPDFVPFDDGTVEPKPTPVEHGGWGSAEAAAAAMRGSVVEDPPPPEPDRVMFWSVNRFRVEVMQAGRKLVVNNQVVPIDHRTIEFEENHWTADMQNPDHVEKVEWLRKSEAVRKGVIVEVPQARPTTQVRITTGPRTAGDRTAVQNIPQRSVAEALTAQL